MNLLAKLFGDPNAKEVARLRKIVDRINGLEASVSVLDDEALKAKTAEFKERLAKGDTLDSILAEAFAVAREASKRVLKQRQYDVQLIGGLALQSGTIAEMRTGEGKTLTAIAPAYLNALTGKGVHVVTVNDYLSRRDAIWMGQVYHALGLSVACIQHMSSYAYDPSFKSEPEHDPERDATGAFRVDMDYLRPISRKQAYAADITYGTNNEFGFDFLRDNMVQKLEDMVQRPLHYAIVDEVDSILIDEARTPLIISAPAAEATEQYYRFAELVARMVEGEDYKVDEKLRASTLTESGISKLEGWLGVDNLYVQAGLKAVHHIEQALRAHALYKKDRDYVVRDGEVIIVDEFTGRLMQGRRYSEGLHQAIEAKERVTIQRESITLATVTFQNYFRLYEKLAGMTGTAVTEAEEFHKIYKLDVLSIPTNKTNQRKDLPDKMYKSQAAKFKAVAQEIKERQAKGQPVLVGTVSIEKNELLSEILKQEGIPHEVLNAKNHEREAEIIAQAGRKGAVTVATNMAGRGVDIILGGNPPSEGEADAVRELGGLHVIGTERHESRRIDNQLRGRAGRQGDPGTTTFYISAEDDLIRIFGPSRFKSLMKDFPDNEAIESKIFTRMLGEAQRKVEGHNFDIRKHLLEYDDVLNKHRSVIYKKRREILEASGKATTEGVSPLRDTVMQMVEDEVEQIVSYHTAAEDPAEWDIEKMVEAVHAILPQKLQKNITAELLVSGIEGKSDIVEKRTVLVETVFEQMKKAYDVFTEDAGDIAVQTEIEKAVMLRVLDDLWISHLESIDYLRHGVGMQGYGQRDPLVEYKKEAYRLFHSLLSSLHQRVSQMIFKVQIGREAAAEESPMVITAGGPAPAEIKEPAASGNTVGRNDPCPCGSGKKFKKCHGA
ncbi:preprotein translocase subunit SecA [Candidatus Uhrbacteria bacterium]|nr:preprotein translocase subunit SecA [Candidatus Uhrbacteria bacterium]